MKRIKVVLGFRLEPTYVEYLHKAFPDVAFALTKSKADVDTMLEGADVFFGWPTDDIIAEGKALSWVHLLGAGADGFDHAPVQRRGIMVTNSKGVAASNIAEHVLALMLGFARALPVLARAQRDQVWIKSQQLRLFEVSGQTLGIVGLGAIGQALAQKAGALGMKVMGVRRKPDPVPGVHTVYGIDELPQMASQVDHLVACLPGTTVSKGLIGEAVFSGMKPGSYFYNVGRGSTVMTEDLLRALDHGPLAGAGLDVVDPEPLPVGHRLWHHPKVVLTSHTAGNTEQYWQRGIMLFERNLRCYLRGERLVNQLDLSNGY